MVGKRRRKKTYLETRVGRSAPNQLDAAVHWTLRPACVSSELCPREEHERRQLPAALRPSEHLHLTETKVFGVGAVVPEKVFTLFCCGLFASKLLDKGQRLKLVLRPDVDKLSKLTLPVVAVELGQLLGEAPLKLSARLVLCGVAWQIRKNV